MMALGRIERSRPSGARPPDAPSVGAASVRRRVSARPRCRRHSGSARPTAKARKGPSESLMGHRRRPADVRGPALPPPVAVPHIAANKGAGRVNAAVEAREGTRVLRPLWLYGPARAGRRCTGRTASSFVWFPFEDSHHPRETTDACRGRPLWLCGRQAIPRLALNHGL